MPSPDRWTSAHEESLHESDRDGQERAYRDPEPWASRFFGGRTAIRTVAWVVIAAMFLVPVLFNLVSVLFR